MSTQAFDEMQHPRGVGGRFATKPAEEAVSELPPTIPTDDMEIVKRVLADAGVHPDCVHDEEHGLSLQPPGDTGLAIYLERHGSEFVVTEKAWGGVGTDAWDTETQLYQGPALADAVDTAWDRVDEAADQGWPVLDGHDDASRPPDSVWGLDRQPHDADYGPAPF